MDQRFPQLFWRTGPRVPVAPCWALEIWGDFSRGNHGDFLATYPLVWPYYAILIAIEKWRFIVKFSIEHVDVLDIYIYIIYIYIYTYSKMLVYQRVTNDG